MPVFLTAPGKRFLYVIAVVMFWFYSSASFAVTYKADYIRKDIDPANYKVGTVIGEIWLESQDFELTVKNMGGTIPDTLEGYLTLGGAATSSNFEPGRPGCVPRGSDGSIGIALRLNATSMVSSCDYSGRSLQAIDGAVATKTGKKEGNLFLWKFSAPRAKIADVVINNPIKARTHAGQSLSDEFYIVLGFSPKAPHQAANPYFSDSHAYNSPFTIYLGESNPAIFFPEQGTSNATLPLDIRPSVSGSGTAMATGSGSVVMCLYDGAGLSKPNYQLMLSDGNVANTSADFALYQQGGTGEIPYTVSLTAPSGSLQSVTNRVPFLWRNMVDGGAAKDYLKYVQLPDGIQGLVPCVPSTVSVRVKPVPYRSLDAGSYRGDLNILFTPSTD